MRPDRYIPAEQAARRIGGMNAFGILESIPGATMSSVSLTALSALITERNRAARARVGNLADFAMEIRRCIWPADATSQIKGLKALTRLTQTAFDVFGPATLDACARFSTSVDLGEDLCRHDWARSRFQAFGGIAPGDSPAHRTLLGQPCGNCQEWYADRRAHRAAVAQRGAALIAERLRAEALAASAQKAEQANRLDRQARALRSQAGALAASAAPPRRSVRLTGADADRAVRAFSRSRTVTASARPQEPADNGTAGRIAKVSALRNAALARGDDTHAATLNGQLSRLRRDL